MKTYKIPCGWEVYGYLEIEAESLEDAVEIAESDDTNLPTKSSYTEGSFWVDRAEIDAVTDSYPPPSSPSHCCRPTELPDTVTRVDGYWNDGKPFEGYLIHEFDGLEDGDHYTDDEIFFYGVSRATIEKSLAESGECKVDDFVITAIVD
jgi:hypothetical protein